MSSTLEKGFYKAIIIGGSAGSFPVVTEILSNLPKNYPIPIIMGLHRLKDIREGFAEALNAKSAIHVEEPYDKQKIKPNRVYLAPSNYHLQIELGNTFSLSTDVMVKHSRPSIDVLFESSAYNFNKKVVGIILSGANSDGANGIRVMKNKGGFTIAQHPDESRISTMPKAAMAATQIDKVLTTKEIISFLTKLA